MYGVLTNININFNMNADKHELNYIFIQINKIKQKLDNSK